MQQKTTVEQSAEKLLGGLMLSCWTRIYPAFANSVDPDQLASEEAN